MQVNAIQCPKCKDVVFSRARHDYHHCTCGGISIDGGFDYLRYGWNPEFKPDDIKHIILELPLTRQEIYDDYNKRIDKYGKNNYYDIEKYITKGE